MDLKTELQNFRAMNLEEIAQRDVNISDSVKNSIFLYNKAIESLKSGSEDIAAIELKKATSMNPEFYEAFNLLGLCYSHLGDKEKAAEAFNKVIKAESNSIVALNYMQRLGMAEVPPVQKVRQSRKNTEQSSGPVKRARDNNTLYKNNSKSNSIKSIVKIGAGFGAGLLLAVLLYSLMPHNENKPLNQPQDTVNSQEQLKADYETKLQELQSKYDLLQKDKDNAVQQADYYKASLKLYEIDALAKDRKYEDAANLLFLMKTVEFKDTEKAKFDELYKSVMPLAAKASFDQGYKLYNSRKYQESIGKLEKVQVYYPEFYRADAALYYMGRSYQALQDSRNAVILYQKLLDSFPESTYAKSASVRIKDLTKNNP